jgi:exopolyphosphatase/guanosine-5'-triphosphate,3'-diphosphate pyrophosphatase
MDSHHRYAAIDLGSNAVRMLLAQVIPNGNSPHVAKESMVRMPLRLGTDTFVHGRITDANADKLVATLIGFSHLMRAYDPVAVRACATSAMRRAANGPDLIDRIREESGFDIQLISGRDEARIILANHVEERLDPRRDYIYVDVGGGSTELTFLPRGEPAASRSFPLGTVRLLTGRVDDSQWERMREWIEEHCAHLSGKGRPRTIGSGGNINKIFNMVGAQRGEAIRRGQIESAMSALGELDFLERVRGVGLRPDRADVIDHAARIYLSVMRWSGAKLMFVPLIGLADGLVHEMYKENAGQGLAC